MTTQVMYNALRLLEAVLRAPYRPKYPVTWTSTHKSWDFTRKLTKVPSWYMAASLIWSEMLTFCVLMYSVLIGTTKHSNPNVRDHIDQICMTFFMHVVLLLILLLEYTIHRAGSELQCYFNAMMAFTPTEKIHRPLFTSRSASELFSAAFHDLTGYLGYSFIGILAIAAPCAGLLLGTKLFRVTVITAVFDQLDQQFSSNFIAALILYVAHFVLLFCIAMEVTANVMVVGTGILFVTSVQVNVLQRLNRIERSHCPSRKTIKTYQQLWVLHAAGNSATSMLVAVTMGAGFYISIFSITFVAHGWSLLSSILYPLLVAITIICMILIYFGLKFATGAYDESEKLVRYWRYNIHSFQQTRPSYTRRLVKSLKPLGFACGDIGDLDNERATTYIYSVIDNAINCIVLLGNQRRRFGLL